MWKPGRTPTHLGLLAVLLTAACRGGKTPAKSKTASTFSTFCDSVRPKVRAFVAHAKAEYPTPDDPRYGGTVVVGTVSDFGGGMNPAITAEYNATQYQQYVLYMTLVGLDSHYRPIPYLAKSWDVNSDTTELTFHLRHDVYWHDGVPTTARDVAFTYQVVTDPATGFPNEAYWDNYAKGDTAFQILDKYTIRFRLRPQADFLDPWRATPILPAHLLENVPHAELRNHPFTWDCPVGNGPFVFDEYRPGDRWVFEANPAFPKELGGRPYLDRLVNRVIPNQSALLSELLSGGIDVYIGAQPEQVQQIEADSALRVEAFKNREVAFVAWNSRKPQLRDRRVRRALTMAVDRAGIVRAVLKGYGTVAATTVAPYHWAYDPKAVPPLPYDPDSARVLLKEAGWVDRNGDGIRENPAGVKLALTIKTNPGSQQRAAILQIMQAELKKVGVEVRPEFVDSNTLMHQIFSPQRDFDGVLMSWISDFKLDDRDLFLSSRVNGQYALSGTHDPAMDKLLDTLQLVVNRRRAKPLWIEYEREQARVQPYTFLYYVERLVGLRRALHGASMDARGEWVNVRHWWLDPAARGKG